MKAKAILAVSMIALFGLIMFLYVHPDSSGNADGLAAADIPAGERSAAPDFVLNDLSGRPVALNEYKGKVVLLGFWTTW